LNTHQPSCHISRPDYPSSAGFVFICPGRYEETNGRPCVGQTGAGLENGLRHLSARRPDLFPSTRRYDYLITNAWHHVEFVAKTGRSVPFPIEVATRQNTERLCTEIRPLTHVVACGTLAHLAVKLCADFLGYDGTIAYVAHTSRQALGCPSVEHYDQAMSDWASQVIEQLDR